MEELEFRAWVKHLEYMCRVISLDFGTGLMCYQGRREDLEYSTKWIDNDDVILMQYTGLKDKNGKKIFAGDIVKYFDWCYCSENSQEPTDLFSWHDNPERYHYYKPLFGVVKWNQEALTYEPLVNCPGDFNNNSFACVCDREGGLADRSKSSFYPASFYEVVGNIWEDPDFLKETGINQFREATKMVYPTIQG